MRGAWGAALEWALALLQVPEQRHLLRQRALPEGMAELLGVAAGLPELVAKAAAQFAEPPQRICDAAKFYVREILFFPGADAYRVLGVEHHATPEQIKQHHRLLQLWLHPDRLQSADDAVFAARVNTAWSQLRTPAARQAYDQQYPAQTVPPAVAPSLHATQGWQPTFAQGAALRRWQRRGPVLLLLAVCVWLLFLSLREMHSTPDMGKLIIESARLPSEQSLEPEIELLPIKEHTSIPTVVKLVPPEAPSSVVSPQQLPQRRKEKTPVVATVLQTPPQLPVQRVTATAPLATARPVAVSQAESQAQPSAAPASISVVDSSRVLLAQQTGEQLLHYLQARNQLAPPIWNSPSAQVDAEKLREAWREGGRVRMDTPQWRIGADNAHLSAAFKQGWGGGVHGRVVAQLRWREGLWLVTGVSMEQIQ